MRISLQTDFKRATRALDLMPRQLVRAGVQATNRVATTVRKEGRNMVAEEVQPRRKKDTGDALTLKRATGATRQAEVVFNERNLGLDKVKGVRVTSFKRGKRRVQKITYKGRVLEGAFRPTNLTKGNKAIFKQVGGKYSTGNRKVRRVYAYSLLQETDKARILKRLEPITRVRFAIEFNRTLRLARSRAA